MILSDINNFFSIIIIYLFGQQVWGDYFYRLCFLRFILFFFKEDQGVLIFENLDGQSFFFSFLIYLEMLVFLFVGFEENVITYQYLIFIKVRKISNFLGNIFF